MPSLDSPIEKSVKQQWEEYVDSFDDPIKKDSWATEGLWRLVGNGEQTDNNCGSFKGFIGCINDEKHSRLNLEGKNYNGLMIGHWKHKSCFSYNCPICYLSWAVHGAHRITDKLESLGVKYGVADHIVLSLPENYFNSNDKNFDKLCKKIVKALQNRGIIAGTYIFHGFRYADFTEAIEKNVKQGWRWSPHFHILGFIRSKKEFYQLIPQMFLEDGFVVNLKAKRESVFGTAWYQLNHASIMPDQNHFEVARWFGQVTDPRSKKMRENSKKIKFLKNDTSIDAIKELFQLETENKKLKTEVKAILNKEHTLLCPICNSKMVKLTYYGLRKDLQRSLVECRKERLPNLTYWKDHKGKLSKTYFLDKIIDSDNQTLNWAET
jgi:hypothetical protein